MTDHFLILFVISSLRLTLPLLMAALGGYFSEKSGVAQIALEAFLLAGAFSAASLAVYTSSLGLTLVGAFLTAALLAQIFLVLVLIFNVNSIIAGTGLNLLAMGLIPIISKGLFDSTGSTPSHTLTDVWVWWPYAMGLTALGLVIFLSERTVWGLQFKFSGEKKEALQALGISPKIRQWQAISLGAGLTGLGGAVLSISMASSYSPLMSAGRGFIALAAVIFGGWSIYRVTAACFLFGAIEALQIQAQSIEWVQQRIPHIYFQLTPYILTLLALWFYKGRSKAPTELA